MILRKIDSMRRIAIPSAVFRELGFTMWQEVEIKIEYGTICIRKFDRKNIQERECIGIVRNFLDEVHHVVIPVEYLKVLGIEKNTMVSLTVENDTIKLNTT